MKVPQDWVAKDSSGNPSKGKALGGCITAISRIGPKKFPVSPMSMPYVFFTAKHE